MKYMKKLGAAAVLAVALAGSPAAAQQVEWTSATGGAISGNVLSFSFFGVGEGTASASLLTGTPYKITVTGTNGGGVFPNGLGLNNGAQNLFAANSGSGVTPAPGFTLVSGSFAPNSSYTIVGTFTPTSQNFTVGGLNTSVSATLVGVPGPLAGAGLPAVLAAAGALFMLRRRKASGEKLAA